MMANTKEGDVIKVMNPYRMAQRRFGPVIVQAKVEILTKEGVHSHERLLVKSLVIINLDLSTTTPKNF